MKTLYAIYGTFGAFSLSRRKRRAVSEIIATLLLMGVTVIGGIIAFTMVGSFTNANSGVGELEVEERIELVGYDSRDGPHLTGIEDIHNDKNSPTPFLCTTSCSANPNNTPDNGGTDFIVIYLRNTGLNDVFLGDIFISTNSITHEWDEDTAGQVLTDASNDLVAPHSYPHAGMYSVVPETGTVSVTQRSSTLIAGTETVRIVIKLSEEISSNIRIDSAIPIVITTVEGNTFKFNIHGGSVL